MSVLGRALSTLRRPTLAAGSGYMLDWPWSGTPPEWWLRGTTAGTLQGAVGAPAFLGVILRLAGAASLCPLHVYRTDGELREKARDSWQWRLLHDGDPVGETIPSYLWADAVASLAGSGNFFARKIFASGRVVELLPRDPAKVRPKRSPTGRVVFEDRTDGRLETVTAREMLHARLIAVPPGSLEGVSPIGALRITLEGALGRQEMESRILRNQARPGLVVKTRRKLTEQQAEEWEEKWTTRHSGPENAGKPTILAEGDEIQVIPVNLQDLQFVEQHRMSREAIGGVYGIPTAMLGDASREVTFEDRNLFATFALGPLLFAIASAINHDADIFPTDATGERLFCEFLTDALLRSSLRERYEAYRVARQGGWISANEIRRKENLPAKEGGDELQQTPVGGAPNPRGGEP